METYKHVVVIGIDGSGNFFRNTSTPNIDKILKNGAKTDYCVTAVPTISAQCWGTMLLGITPYTHRLDNGIVSSRPYTDTENPSVFSLVRKARPDAVLGAFCNWAPIYIGIIEQGIGVTTDTGEDGPLTDKIVEYIKAEKPDFLFVQFDGVDHAGHAHGYGSENHLAELTLVDSYVGKIYDSVVSAGMAEETLFIVTADHGGLGHSHGGLSDTERFVFFGASGKTVCENDALDMRVIDIPSIICAALGVEGSRNWESYLPQKLFCDNASPAPRPASKTDVQYMPARETPSLSALSVKPRYAYRFDGCVEGGSTTGKVYFPKGVFGSAARVSTEGFVTLDSVSVGADSFTFAFWLLVNSVSYGEHVIMANKEFDLVTSTGFAVSFFDSVQFRAAQAGKEWRTYIAFDTDPKDEWTHVALTVDRCSGEVSTYINFKPFETHSLPEEFDGLTLDNTDGLPVRIGDDGTGKRGMGADISIDDLFIYDRALSADEIAALGKYYTD